jgi:nucleotide-binding universal stress UspA family protein
MPEGLRDYSRKFLVVVDETPESDRAVTFAAHRVRRTGGTVVLLAVIETAEFQQFLGVEEVMRAEARQEAERLLETRVSRISAIGNIRTETVVAEGPLVAAVEKAIASDAGIGILVLAAANSKDAPGSLVTAFTGRSASAAPPVIITIIPSRMTDDEIVAVT